MAAVLIMAAALLLSFFDFSFSGKSGGHITLPGEDTPDVGVDMEEYVSNLEMLQSVKIDRSNIKKLIGAMQRPERYHLAASTTIYYSGGQSTTAAECYVSGGRSRTMVFGPDGVVERHLLLSGEDVYIWKAGASTYYTGRAGSFTSDDLIYVPTYEKILELEDDEILSADFSLYNEVYCIVVEAMDSRSGCRCLYYISVEEGLLVGAQRFEGETLVYALSAEVLAFPEQEDDLFKLPDGTSVPAGTV